MSKKYVPTPGEILKEEAETTEKYVPTPDEILGDPSKKKEPTVSSSLGGGSVSVEKDEEDPLESLIQSGIEIPEEQRKEAQPEKVGEPKMVFEPYTFQVEPPPEVQKTAKGIMEFELSKFDRDKIMPEEKLIKESDNIKMLSDNITGTKQVIDNIMAEEDMKEVLDLRAQLSQFPQTEEGIARLSPEKRGEYVALSKKHNALMSDSMLRRLDSLKSITDEYNASGKQLNDKINKYSEALRIYQDFAPFAELTVPKEVEKLEGKEYWNAMGEGMLKNFSVGMESLFRSIHGATLMLDDLTGGYMGFKSRIPNIPGMPSVSQFEQLADWYKMASEQFRDTPDDFFGSIVAGTMQFLPMAVELALTPEIRFARLARASGGYITGAPKFANYCGYKRATIAYNHLDKEQIDMSLLTKGGTVLKEAAKGFAEGYAFNALLNGSQFFNGLYKVPYGAAAFGTFETARQMIADGELNLRDIGVSMTFGAGFTGIGMLGAKGNLLKETLKKPFNRTAWQRFKTLPLEPKEFETVGEIIREPKFWRALRGKKELKKVEAKEVEITEDLESMGFGKKGDIITIEEFNSKIDAFLGKNKKLSDLMLKMPDRAISMLMLEGRLPATLKDRFAYGILGKSMQDIYGFGKLKHKPAVEANYYSTLPETRKGIIELPIAEKELRDKANLARTRMENETNAEKKNELAVATRTLETMTDIKNMSARIIQNPRFYTDMILKDPNIPPKLKTAMVENINKMADEYSPKMDEAKDIQSQIETLRGSRANINKTLPEDTRVAQETAIDDKIKSLQDKQKKIMAERYDTEKPEPVQEQLSENMEFMQKMLTEKPEVPEVKPVFEIDGKKVTEEQFRERLAEPEFKEKVKAGEIDIRVKDVPEDIAKEIREIKPEIEKPPVEELPKVKKPEIPEKEIVKKPVVEELTKVPTGIKPEEAARYIAEESKSPEEIAAYRHMEESVPGLSGKEQIISDNLSRFPKEGFLTFGDKSMLEGKEGKTKRLNYFNEKGVEIDIQARDMSDEFGVKITPDDIVKFINKFPSGEKVVEGNEDIIRLEDAYRNLTGKKLTPAIAEEAYGKLREGIFEAAKTPVDRIEEAIAIHRAGTPYERVKIEGKKILDYLKEKTDEIGKEEAVRLKEDYVASEKIYREEQTKMEEEANKVIEQFDKKGLEEDLLDEATKAQKDIDDLGGAPPFISLATAWSKFNRAAFKNAVFQIKKGVKTAAEFAKKMGQKLTDGLSSIFERAKAFLRGKRVTKAEIVEKPEMADMKLADEALNIKGKVDEKPAELKDIGKRVKAKKGLIETENKRVTKNMVRDMVFDRRVEISLGAFETNLFVDGINRKTNKEEREVIPFLIERTGVPEELGRRDLEETYAESKDKLKPIVNEVREHFDNMWKKIVENTDKLSTEQIKDYVTHIWDIPANKRAEVIAWFSVKNKFLNKRYIETLEDGIKKFGLKPKTLDIGEIIRIHASVTNNVIANKKFLEDLKNLGRNGMPMILRADKAPPDWVTIDHPALTTTIYIPEIEGKPAKLIPMPYKVHPDLKKPMLVVFDKLIDHPVAHAWENITGILKKTQLSISFFHHGALTETAIAKMGVVKTVTVAGKDVIYKGLKSSGKPPTFENPELTKDAIEAGVQFGTTVDIPVKKIQKYLDNMAEKAKGTPAAEQITWFLKTFNEKWDKGLWDYLHDGLKLYAFEDVRSKMPKGTKDPKKYLREHAALINDTFGGQNWDVLMVNPKTVQMLRWFLLSPDWTVSTIRQALAPTGIGRMYKETAGVRRKAGAMFWLKAAIYFGVSMNALNYYFRKKDVEENPQYYKGQDLDFWDYTMYGNSVGHKTHLFTGRFDDGSESYRRTGKQFREMPELLMDDEGMSFPKPALKKLGGKLSPGVQITSQLLTGRTASGYENWDLRNKKGWEWTLGAMKMFAKSPLPFSSSSLLRDDKEWYPMDLVMPGSKGMTPTKAINLFKKGIARGDEDYVREVYTGAVRNNLDAFSLFNAALTTVKAEGTRELTRDAKTVEDINKKLKETIDKVEIQKLKRRRNALKKSNVQKEQGIKQLDGIIKRMEAGTLMISKIKKKKEPKKPTRPTRPSRPSRYQMEQE